jgi:hypothetical protein
MREKPDDLLSLIRDDFKHRFGDADGALMLAFVALVSGCVMRTSGVVILEGDPAITSLVASGALSVFPKRFIHRETAGLKGLINHASSAKSGPKTARLLHLPGIDDRIRIKALEMLGDWGADRGYTHEYIDKEGDRCPVDLGHVGIIATCMSARKLPPSFLSDAWLLHPELKEDQLSAIQDASFDALASIQCEMERLLEGTRDVVINDVFARALSRSLIGSPNECYSQNLKVKCLANAVTVLRTPGVIGTRSDSYSDISVVQRLLRVARPLARPLTPGERTIYDRILRLTSTGSKQETRSRATVSTGEIYHLAQDLDVTERTIRNWLKNMVDDRVLLRINDGTKLCFQIAYSVNVDEKKLIQEIDGSGGSALLPPFKAKVGAT